MNFQISMNELDEISPSVHPYLWWHNAYFSFINHLFVQCALMVLIILFTEWSFCMKNSVFDKTANNPYLSNNKYTRLKINVGCDYLCFIPLPIYLRN